MDLTTQPVLCCIGQSVAGQATQYVMQRLCSAYNLDWQVLSVEVESERFQTAIAGMEAMNFSAIRLYGEFQSEAVQGLNLTEPIHRFVGLASSAKRTAEGWQAWHSLGYGVMQHGMREQQWERCGAFVCGDSLLARSFIAAFANSEAVAKLFADAALVEQIEVSEQLENSEDKSAEAGFKPEVVEAVQELSEEEIELLLEQHSLSDVMLIGSLRERELEAYVTTTQEKGIGLIIAAEVEGLSESELEARFLDEAGITFLTHFDQQTLAEAYDFTRWTDTEVDGTQIRDAYEEFVEF